MSATGALTWTYIVRCLDCGRELNRAEHVPTEKKAIIPVVATFCCFCPIESHNTALDFNLHWDGEWINERESAGGDDGARADN